MTTVAASHRTPRLRIPPQHGAWAFLVVPLLLGLAVGGWSLPGVVFALVWICAYPVSYYGGRALVARWRRGTWTQRARREAAAAVPWAVVVAVLGAGLLVLRPWLAAVAVGLAGLWLVSLWLTRLGRERGLANDLLLVGQSCLAVPLVAMVSADSVAVPGSVWLATAVCAAFFTGSVIHVKSLIREAGDPRWHHADLVYHAAALGLVLLSPWLVVPFGAALARSVALRPGVRPPVIGGVEAAVSVLLVIFTVLAINH